MKDYAHSNARTAMILLFIDDLVGRGNGARDRENEADLVCPDAEVEEPFKRSVQTD